MSAGGLGSIAAAAAAQQSAAVAAPDGKGDTVDDGDDEMPGLEPAEETGFADESVGDLDPKEIETVMDQVCRVLSLSQQL